VLSEDEIFATCILLLIAGNETTTNLIGTSMLALFRILISWSASERPPHSYPRRSRSYYATPDRARHRPVPKEDIAIAGHTFHEGRWSLPFRRRQPGPRALREP
jgi:cytochrome P450